MPRALTQAQIDDFRDQLRDVAAALFALHGFEAVTMRQIASELGVSAMTPYRYFPCKASIYAAARTEAFERFGARVDQAARAERDPLERLRALFRAYVRFALDEPGSYRLMFQLDPPDEANLAGEQLEVARSTWGPLLRALDDAVERGLLDGDPLTLAHLCWIQVHGLVSLHLANRLQFDRSLEDLIEPAIENLLSGSLARPAKGPAS